MTAIETKCGTRAAGKLGQRGRQNVSDQGIQPEAVGEGLPLVGPGTGFGDSRTRSANAASRGDVMSASTQ